MNNNENTHPMDKSDGSLWRPLVDVSSPQGFSIESGYFIFTLMPSLRCDLSCPHCYLSLEQRRHSPVMSLADLQTSATRVARYYESKNLARKNIIFYWYGGEPTQMGIDYFTHATQLLNATMPSSLGFVKKHTVLTSLLMVDEATWFPFFREHCGNHFQTSFDGAMRGKGYVKKWEQKVRHARSEALEVGTISVVNRDILQTGAIETLDYLSELGVKEVSFLPFMWNEQNNGAAYDRYAPSMNAWSDFMIEVSQHYFRRKAQGAPVPEIGQMNFILHQTHQPQMANVAGQTLFLLPNGDFVLPDYKNGYQEYMRPFGNILSDSFESILRSRERKSYLRTQVLRNHNAECLECEHADKCVMEFWKKNKPSDDCFGGKRYVQWLLSQQKNKDLPGLNPTLY